MAATAAVTTTKHLAKGNETERLYLSAMYDSGSSAA